MINIFNLTNEKNGLSALSGKYILAKDKSIADVLILSSNDVSNIEISHQLFAVCFVDTPSEEIVSSLLLKGILSFTAPKDNLIKNITNFCENGNISGSLCFNDLNLGENDNTRLSFIVKDLLDPITTIMDMLSGLNIPITKMSATRRDDGISYVVLETSKKDIQTLSFKNEEGSHILRYIKID